MYGYCQESMFFNSKVAVAKKLGEQPPDFTKHFAEQEAKRQADLERRKPRWIGSRAEKKVDRGRGEIIK